MCAIPTVHLFAATARSMSTALMLQLGCFHTIRLPTPPLEQLPLPYWYRPGKSYPPCS